MHTIAQILYMMVPVVIAGGFHMVVVKRDWWSKLRIPVDGHRTWRGKRLFGENKTWRGFIVLPVGTILLVCLQALLYQHFEAMRSLSLFDYVSLNPLRIGAVMSFGYLLSELPNSFLKRQLEVPPGVTVHGAKGIAFLVLDQIDSVTGFVLLLPLFWTPTPGMALEIFGVGALLHLAFNAVFFLAGVRRRF